MEQKKFTNLHEQMAYGALLEKLVNVSMIVLFISFVLYVGGFLAPLIPIEQLSTVWNLPLEEFLAQTDAPTGWQWVNHIHTGDYLSFAGIAFLVAITGICYLVLLIGFAKDGHKIYLFITSAEIGLIILAAANVMGGSGH